MFGTWGSIGHKFVNDIGRLISGITKNPMSFSYILQAIHTNSGSTKDFRASGRLTAATAAITLTRLFVEMLCYVSTGKVSLYSYVLSTRSYKNKNL